MTFRPKRDIIIAIVYDVVKRRRFDSRIDLRETVKEQCARRKIPGYDTVRVDDAIDHVARRRSDIPVGEPTPPPVLTTRPPLEPRPIPREDATDRDPPTPLYDRDPIAFARQQLRRRFAADRVRAARVVMQEITASIARCETLEAALSNEGEETR